MLPIRNRSLLRRYYEKAFESLQQINCRILAKAYIKLVEPRKQVNYPYNGRKIISGTSQQFDPELTKPAWWPSGVTHREPDHLLKPGRLLGLFACGNFDIDLPQKESGCWCTSCASCERAMPSASTDSRKPTSPFDVRYHRKSACRCWMKSIACAKRRRGISMAGPVSSYQEHVQPMSNS